MKHRTAFGLCLAVIVLTAMVVATAGLLLYEKQDVGILRDRVRDLSEENATLRARLQKQDGAARMK